MSKKEIQGLLKKQALMQAALDKHIELIKELYAVNDDDEMLRGIDSRLPLFLEIGRDANPLRCIRESVNKRCHGHRRIMIDGLRSREKIMRLMVQDIYTGYLHRYEQKTGKNYD